MINGSRWSLVLVVIGALTAGASADMYSFAFGDLAAEVNLDIDGSNLVITLENTAAATVQNPAELLTGVFFSLDAGVTLTQVSVELSAGSSVLNPLGADQTPNPDGLDDNDEMGGEWGFRDDLGPSVVPSGANIAIGVVGMDDLLGPPHLFPGDNLDDPDAQDGMNYGIVSDGGLDPDAVQMLTLEPLVRNGVIITLSASAPFSLSAISGVMVNYGTGLNPVPAPGAAVLCMIGLGVVGFMKRRRTPLDR